MPLRGPNRFASVLTGSNAPSSLRSAIKSRSWKNWKLELGSLSFPFEFRTRCRQLSRSLYGWPLAHSTLLSHAWQQWLLPLSRTPPFGGIPSPSRLLRCCRRQLLIFPLNFHPSKPFHSTLSALIAMIFNYYRCRVCSAFGRKKG